MTVKSATKFVAGTAAAALIVGGVGAGVAFADESDWWPEGEHYFITTSVASPGSYINVAVQEDPAQLYCNPASEGDNPGRSFELVDESQTLITELVIDGAGGSSSDAMFYSMPIPSSVDASSPIAGAVLVGCAHTDGTPTEIYSTLPLTIVDEVESLYEFEGQWTWHAQPALEANAELTVRAMGFRPGETVSVAEAFGGFAPFTVTADNAGAIIATMTVPSDWDPDAFMGPEVWGFGESSKRAVSIYVAGGVEAPSVTPLTTPGGPAEGQAYEHGVLKVSVVGFPARENVRFALHASLATAAEPIVLGTVKTSAAGAATASFVLPEGVTGEFELFAGQKSGGDGWLLSTPVEIVPVPGDAVVDVATPTVYANGSVEVSGAGFEPGESVELSLHSTPVHTLKTVTADGSGEFTTTVSIPKGVTGAHSIWATGADTGLVLRSEVTVNEFASPVPTVSGDLRVGSEVSAVTDGWASGSTFTYQWLREGKTIKGATAQLYTLTSKDKGKRISVRVVGTSPGFAAVSKTSARTAKVASGVLAVGTPVISGDARVGSTLSVDPGVWTVGSKFKYQWYVNGKAVSKATKASWKVTSSAWGKFVSVRVTGSLSGYTSAAILGELSTPVADGSFAVVPTPTITGVLQAGKTVKAVPGTWSPKASLSYQWRINGLPVAGATKSSWKIPANAPGAVVSVTVTGSAAGFVSVQTHSAGSTVLHTLSGATPKITGTAKVGEALTAVPGAWTESTTLSYQWLRASSSTGKLTEIAGAVDATYVLGATDKGKYLAVKVTGQQADYADLAKTSKRTKKVK